MTNQMRELDAVKSKHKVNYQLFGRLVWKWVKQRGGDIFDHEDSEELMQVAQRAGLVRRVIYDPAVHGEGIDADPDSEIWYWGTGGKD